MEFEKYRERERREEGAEHRTWITSTSSRRMKLIEMSREQRLKMKIDSTIYRLTLQALLPGWSNAHVTNKLYANRQKNRYSKHRER